MIAGDALELGVEGLVGLAILGRCGAMAMIVGDGFGGEQVRLIADHSPPLLFGLVVTAPAVFVRECPCRSGGARRMAIISSNSAREKFAMRSS